MQKDRGSQLEALVERLPSIGEQVQASIQPCQIPRPIYVPASYTLLFTHSRPEPRSQAWCLYSSSYLLCYSCFQLLSRVDLLAPSRLFGNYFCNITMHQHLSNILPLSILLLQARQARAFQCYAPDGFTATENQGNYEYLPCIVIQGVDSMSCGMNGTSLELTDACMPNGLCYRDQVYYRDFCTDSTWKSPNCLSNTICSVGVILFIVLI